MASISFNDGWSVAPQVSLFARLFPSGDAKQVTLPHDALISTERSAEHRGKGAFFPSGAFEYTKRFDAPDEWRDRRVSLHFDGVYRDAMVFVNGALAGHRPSGYASFDVELNPFLEFGATNTLRVDVRTHDDSRWYAGAGIYRDVRLDVRSLVHLDDDGIHVRTPEVADDIALVETVLVVRNDSRETRTVRARVALRDDEGVAVGTTDQPVTVLPGSTATARLRLFVDAPRRWSCESPALYTADVTLNEDDVTVDDRAVRFGIRSVQLDARRGLRINGEDILLRGACIHHDNGPLGAAAWRAAEERKIRLLKEAGFNAVRSAHNPMSEAMLDACDRLGMLVMDEAFDSWTVQKSSFDYTVSFAEWWRRDLSALVRRDRNHPSVVFYSIGNEIPETGDRWGAHLSREMAEAVRALDPDRFVTNGINGFVSVIDDVIAGMAAGAFAPPPGEDAGGLNDVMASASDGMNQLSRSEGVSRRTEEAFAVLDLAGLNYGDSRYELDRELFPGRVIVGSETYPARISTNWQKVRELPNVIGDFTWTGWDYLGEVGIGRAKFEGEPMEQEAPYPWLAAWCGDLDITGFRRPASYFRQIVFGLRNDPYIAVQDPETFGRRQYTGTWAWTPSQCSWTWNAAVGASIAVEVYAAADEVELLVGDTSHGRLPAGPDAGYTAVFDVTYQPDAAVTAIAYVDGTETGRSVLHGARGDARLRVSPESPTVSAAEGELAFIAVEIVDDEGTVLTSSDRSVGVTIEGPGQLLALGSARPDNSQPFHGTQHDSFRGRLLAVVRPTGAGTIVVSAKADGLDETVGRVEVVAAASVDAA